MSYRRNLSFTIFEARQLYWSDAPAENIVGAQDNKVQAP